MDTNAITDNMKVETTTGLLNFDKGSIGRVKFTDKKIPFGASGKTVMVTFTSGGGLYYSPEDFKAA